MNETAQQIKDLAQACAAINNVTGAQSTQSVLLETIRALTQSMQPAKKAQPAASKGNPEDPVADETAEAYLDRVKAQASKLPADIRETIEQMVRNGELPPSGFVVVL